MTYDRREIPAHLLPYFQDAELGLEATVQEYVERLVGVFREVRRVLRPDGLAFLNLGDSYAGSWGAQGRGEMDERSVVSARQIAAHPRKQRQTGSIRDAGLKPKDLIGVPWRVAFALQADGWWLRDAIVWAKPNPMPSSVEDRCTSSYEMVFMLAKSARYFSDMDAVREPLSPATLERIQQAKWQSGQQAGSTRANGGAKTNGPMRAVVNAKGLTQPPQIEDGDYSEAGANLRNVWTIATTPFTGWTKTVRRAPVAAGERGDDTRRITSADCPEHGDSSVADSIRAYGERVAGSASCTSCSDAHRAQAPTSEPCSIDQSRADCSAGESLDSSPPHSSMPAIEHNNRTRKTGHEPATIPPCNASVGSASHIGNRSVQPSQDDSAGRTPENSIAPVGSGDHPLERSRFRIADMPSCTCEYVRETSESTSHFATMPLELALRCIRMGSREGDVILDPFMGSGTTAQAAESVGRRFVGVRAESRIPCPHRGARQAARPLWRCGMSSIPRAKYERAMKGLA